MNRRPSPACEDDIQTIVSLFPTNTHLRALRLWDFYAEQLSLHLLSNLFNIPESLKFIVWGGGKNREFFAEDEWNKEIVYRIERKEGRVRALECEHPRAAERYGPEDVWVNKCILDL